jgi:hypothetical protein
MTVLQEEQRKVILHSNLLMSLTSIHHIYGAIIYNTPWRMHVLLLSIPVIIATFFLGRLLSQDTYHFKTYLFWIYWVIILLASILTIGVFEGLYNHLLKNILFFGGLPENRLNKLFPANMYEMPNDLFFEISGMIQGIVAVPLIIHFFKLTRENLKQSTAPTR